MSDMRVVTYEDGKEVVRKALEPVHLEVNQEIMDRDDRDRIESLFFDEYEDVIALGNKYDNIKCWANGFFDELRKIDKYLEITLRTSFKVMERRDLRLS